MATALASSRLHQAPSRGLKEVMTNDRVASSDASPREQEARLIVRRQDIEFTDVGPGRVEIAVTVTNDGPRRSPKALAVLQAAPLGAFVDWRPLTVLRVPALETGESAVLRTEADRVIPKPLGPPDRLPPARLLTALDFGEREPGKAVAPPSVRPKLPPSPIDLLTGPNTYWAGNINIFVGGKAVERHMAKALRILPERTNVAAFFVGGGPDYYRFDLLGLGPDWHASIVDAGNATSMAQRRFDRTAIEPGSWISFGTHSFLFLALRPPANCRQADVEVHVTQRSTQKTAVVEFSFDPQAAGPGCYVVD